MTLTTEEAEAIIASLSTVIRAAVGQNVQVLHTWGKGIKEVQSGMSSYKEFEYDGTWRVKLEMESIPPYDARAQSGMRPTPCGCVWSPGPNSMIMECPFHHAERERLTARA